MNEINNKYGDGELRRKLGAGDRGRTAAVTIEGRSPSSSILIKLRCLFVFVFVCLFVLKLLLGKSICIGESYIAGCVLFRAPILSILQPDTITRQENIPKKLILGLLNILIFSGLQNAVIFLYNPLFIKTS